MHHADGLIVAVKASIVYLCNVATSFGCSGASTGHGDFQALLALLLSASGAKSAQSPKRPTYIASHYLVHTSAN